MPIELRKDTRRVLDKTIVFTFSPTLSFGTTKIVKSFLNALSDQTSYFNDKIFRVIFYAQVSHILRLWSQNDNIIFV
ncbi:MAG: hypothetical protein COX06_00390 [Candidatus Zambryskibacteria bacterium CG22_combo_CG10-13_8_21_14_all_42_17]|uniref:Uncharacterized protein n=1 Tax=Candidatus Zambryskibacteria bacterium CG22_combo_CG10-13_8_21_14_all_42_17 TaxID=1975118 RepID=A0A2H0BE03_9BACT|nr:MAG: hypothetical protein COX06_00390 [Candidatus Zambryskibacteria bacterium CG22_combo_CG10-13_8_21_14_all_42_17]